MTREEVEKLFPWMRALRRELHRHPELAGEEYQTAAVVERELDSLGITHKRTGGTGVLAVIKGEGPGPAAALRADMDALPIQEQGTADYRSETDGKMHACGHDAHTAMLLGAARLLSDSRESWGGEVRLIFQQGEETGLGAPDFLEAGTLNGVSRALALHVAPDLPVGTIGVRPGMNKASTDIFKIEVQGKSVHVSTPEQGIDALYIASQIVVALQAQVTRRTSPLEPVVVGVGRFQSGTAYNAVAERAVLEGTTRTFTQASRMRVRELVDITCSSVAQTYGGTAGVTWNCIHAPLVNDEGAAAEVRTLIETERPDLQIKTDYPLTLSGDNFSEFLLEVPGVYAYLGTANPARPETCRQIHSAGFDLDEAALPIGAWLYAAAARRWLEML